MAYELNEARRLVIRAGKELQEKGLIVRTWGNISARISDTQFVITPSGKAYDTLTPEDIVIVNIADLSYEGDIKPSSEKAIHGDAYRLRPDCNFIIHTHQNFASCLSVTGQDIRGIDLIAPNLVPVLGKVVPCASYGMNATPELRAAVASAILYYPDSRALLMKHHGTECMGTSYEDAFAIADALEQVSKAVFEASAQPYLKELTRQMNVENLNAAASVGKGEDLYPYTRAYSHLGETLLPYIDDFAMLVGTDIPCLLDSASENEISECMEGRGAVLIQNKGAILSDDTPDDEEAIHLVLEKNCMAAILGKSIGGLQPVPEECAKEEHIFYIEKYSKLK